MVYFHNPTVALFKEQLEHYYILQCKERPLICLLPSIHLSATAEAIILALIKPLNQRHMYFYANKVN